MPIRTDLTNEQYHALPAVGKSMLDSLARSPAHYHAMYIAKVIERQETAAMALGTAVHCAVLEPQRFAKEYVCAPVDAPKRPTSIMLGAAKPSPETVERIRFWAQFDKENIGKTVIDAQDMATAVGMAKSVRAHPAAGILLKHGAAERSYFWRSGNTECKVRPDWITADGRILVDLKTTDDARPPAFQRSVENFRYFVQAAMYLDGVSANQTHVPEAFLFIVVEKTAPFATVIYRATPEMIEDGRAEYQRNLATLEECTKSGIWNAYPDEILAIDRPKWARSQEKFEVI